MLINFLSPELYYDISILMANQIALQTALFVCVSNDLMQFTCVCVE